MIAASAHPSSASSQFGSNSTKASRLHALLAFVFAGLASTLSTNTRAHYTLHTLAGTATEQRTEQTASGTNRLQSHSHTYTSAGFRRWKVVPARYVFLPAVFALAVPLGVSFLSSGVINPIGRLGGSGGVVSSRTASSS